MKANLWSTLLAFRHLREYLDSFFSTATALRLVLLDTVGPSYAYRHHPLFVVSEAL